MPSEHIRNITDSISYDQCQMDNTAPPAPPYNPMTETVDMFNVISDEETE